MNENRRLADSDFRFMTVIWDNEPVGSMRLVDLCADALGWKKSTTFTMLRKMCAKGMAKNEHSTVTSLVSREQVRRTESERFVSETFSGSLPGFLVAFMDGKTLSDKEVDELKRLIDEHRKG
ncbi:MAG: BlaI/MecI/CopY family transcriptional regulator [Clostridia bacterium]|nr:BlaI/MecI/CopY family transcriptional regulator [Clostridia bacterium]MBR4185596.1 BlaI/MecI/CopY family transcriptional regulator [Clostridia bacterium]